MKEAELNKKIQDLIFARGGYVVKLIVSNRNGVPDIITCYRGLFFAIEGKRPGMKGNTSDLQKDHIRQIIAAGGIAIVADSLQTVIDVLDELDAGDHYKAVLPPALEEFTL